MKLLRLAEALDTLPAAQPTPNDQTRQINVNGKVYSVFGQMKDDGQGPYNEVTFTDIATGDKDTWQESAHTDRVIEWFKEKMAAQPQAQAQPKQYTVIQLNGHVPEEYDDGGWQIQKFYVLTADPTVAWEAVKVYLHRTEVDRIQGRKNLGIVAAAPRGIYSHVMDDKGTYIDPEKR